MMMMIMIVVCYCTVL